MPFRFGSRSSTQSSHSSASSSSRPNRIGPTSAPAADEGEERTDAGEPGSRRLKPILAQSSTGEVLHESPASTPTSRSAVTLVSSSDHDRHGHSDRSESALHRAVSRGSRAHGDEPSADDRRRHDRGSHPLIHPARSFRSKGHSASSTRRHTEDHYELPEIRNPIQLAETAITILFNIPGPPPERLRDLVPQLYHEAYVHRVNCREHGLEEVLSLVQRFRSRYSSVKVKFRSNLMDMDGTASMHASAVGLVYDIVARPTAPQDDRHHQHPNRSSSLHSHDEVEPLRAAVISVVKIFEGRLAQVDMVVDTKEMQTQSNEPELSCSIM
ncbi:hypothetical protein JCM8202_004322 [Rhodotorula sphaerocarpa]